MQIAVGLMNGIGLKAGGAPPPGAVSEIAADGFTAVSSDPGAALGQSLWLVRQGYTAAGLATTVSEAVTVRARRREPYPSTPAPSGPAVLTTDRVILSDYIYASDVIAGVANNSAWAAPLPIPCWLTVDNLLAQGASHRVRLAVAHAHARLGRPVAAVKFFVTDGTVTIEQTVTTMVSAQFAAGLYAPFFEWDIPLAGLAQGALCTVDVVIYPWVGRAYQASVDGSAYPSPNFSVLKFTCDRTGAFGTAYAYVDPGATGGGAVSASAAMAAAAPFPTIAAAATAIQSFNNTNHARNNASGGVIRLVEGTHTHSSYGGVAMGNVPLRIEAAGAKAATIYQDSGANTLNSTPHKLHLKGLTLKKTGASVTMFDTSAALANMDRQLILEDVGIDLNGTSNYGAWIYRVGRVWLIGVTTPEAFGTLWDNYGGTNKAVVLALGCSGAGGSNLYNAIAGKLTRFQRVAAQTNVPAGEGQMASHSQFSVSGAGIALMAGGSEIGARGFAIIGNVIEHRDAITGPVLRFHADTDLFPAQNVVSIGNTVVGSRSNWLYQDLGTTSISKRGYRRFNVDRNFNIKCDLFTDAPGARDGNWGPLNNVGCRANATLRGAYDGKSTWGPGNWLGEVAAPGDVSGSEASPLVVNWLDDQSYDGGKAGWGDYTPGIGNVLPVIPAGLAPYPIDQKGRAIRDDGTARIGARQMAA